ncbi:MAG: carbon-nitrogen hydrolase family protein [Rhizobiales bacterium]|nr:carbon-nitrogen hydrolase family protein [Hyphomicrobiales bacterium]NRB15697.1 carbon-nitrogen hydrolase family protein [Hyphomicrobiales bacterium]
MARNLQVACIQLCAGQNVQENIDIADGFIRQAAAAGAKLIATPEQTSLMELAGVALFENIYLQEDCPSFAHFKRLAKELKIYLSIGSLAILNKDGSVSNRGFLFAPDGHVISHYNKIHMFDMTLGDGESYQESATYKAGENLTFVQTALFGFGHSICYDLRFPKLYNRLAHMGAEIISVPSAFTKTTGSAHWHILLRARAIETGSFIMAAAQGGRHQNGRDTFGHSLIINPWGEVLAEMKNDENGQVPTGYIMAEIDLDDVAKTRERIPVLQNEGNF